ncbi:hypothetical protein FHG87_015018 [Trinorchestia longiramus]|nr:hypothetical protein FHG87_015018 [Trinorchestia longiramus]
MADDGADVQLGAAAEATVLAYHELAMDPDKRLHLALDETCLQFLSLVIGNGNNSLVCKALSTLAALTESPECRAPMASTFGVLHSLRASVEEDNEHTDEMKSQSAELFTCLNFALYQQRAARRRSKMPSETSADQSSLSASAQTSSAEHRLEDVQEQGSKASAGDQADGEVIKISIQEIETVKDTKKDDKDTDRGKLERSDSVESTCSTISQSSSSLPCQQSQTSGSGAPGERGGSRNDPAHPHQRALHTRPLALRTPLCSHASECLHRSAQTARSDRKCSQKT